MSYEAVIGLEVHVQLATTTKIFCRCPNRYGAEPNTLVCPVCLGYPGTLPVLDRRAVDLAIRLALALGAEVQPWSAFARKSYFYPDLPKGYQITQLDRPLATGGRLPLTRHDRTVLLRRLHLEEDAGKLIHGGGIDGGGDEGSGVSRVDFNRCGVPLVEIVSEPELRSPAEAQDYLRSLHQLLLFTATSDGNMEEGSLRCDANVSVRPAGSRSLGTRTEVKNLNSFRHLARALEFEIERQSERLAAGERVVAETRGFDAATGHTHPLRSKEEAHDYRYFPEPDLPPLSIAPERIERIAAELPELPWELRHRLESEHGLAADDAQLIGGRPELAGYFERAVEHDPAHPRAVANWLKTEILRELKERRCPLDRSPAPERLAALVALVEGGGVSASAGKEVLAAMWDDPAPPAEIAGELGLVQLRDPERISGWVRQACAENPALVAEYRAGKSQLLGYFVGQVMRLSGGRADPRAVRALARAELGAEGSER
jgi:aspartyl-tRNA(Asn)/glutamyl-tRNA(Gln) amidotransferase subunit B